MNSKIALSHLGVLALAALVAGCVGKQAFTKSAEPGETIAIGVGYAPNLTRSDITVQITDANASTVTYNAGEPHVRALMQGYPDPLSKLVVSDVAQMSFPNAGIPNFDSTGTNAPTYPNAFEPYFADYVRSIANGTNSWMNTILYLDLPVTLAPGTASISVLDSSGNPITPNPITINVLAGGSDTISRFPMGNSSISGIKGPLRSVEQASHFNVNFSGPSGVIPFSIQADFVRTLGPEGRAWVTHSRGDLTNVAWNDNGSLITVMQMPTNGAGVGLLSDFNFYVTGAVTSLTVNSVKAYDISGNPLSGFTATLQQVNN